METLSQSSTARIEHLRLKPTAKSDDSFIERMDVDIIENQTSMLSDQNDCSDFTCKDTDEIDNEYSRVETKNKIDNKNQKVNTKKLFKQLSNSRVVLKRLTDSIISQKLQPTESSKLIIENENTNKVDAITGTAVIHSKELKTSRTRYCSKCKVVVPNTNKYRPNASCKECGNPLHFQCVHCYSVFTIYKTLYQHLIRNSCRIAKVDSNSENKPKLIEMMKRYCSKCKAVDPNVNVSTKKLCTKCGHSLHFQCVQCYFVFTIYKNLYRHLIRKSCRIAKVDSDSENKPKSIEMMKRYCSKCKAVDPNVNVSTKKSCTKCGNSLHFQCVQCYSVFTIYRNLYRHLIRKSCRFAKVYSDSENKLKPIEMMKRYCSKCKAVDPNVNVSTKKLCTKCGNSLHFQCVQCYSVFTIYNTIYKHLMKNLCKIAEVEPDSENKLKQVEMMKRYCSKCKAVDPNVTVCTKKSCTKCRNRLHFQCVHCYRVYTSYRSMSRHLKMSCSLNEESAKNNNMRHKCNKCNFEAVFKQSLTRHYTSVHTLDEDTNSTMAARYCIKCEVVESNFNVSCTEPCRKCGMLLYYQCVSCSRSYKKYRFLLNHIKKLCNSRKESVKNGNEYGK